jgi:hypothetical protein
MDLKAYHFNSEILIFAETPAKTVRSFIKKKGVIVMTGARDSVVG